jgi:hypothetical protein
LIQVVERGNVEEIKERPQKRAASIAASQALGVVSVPPLPRNAAPPSPERGRKRNKSDETNNRRSQPRLSRPAVAVKEAVASSLLRHRVFFKQCQVGVTGDKKHDRFCMMSSPPCIY